MVLSLLVLDPHREALPQQVRCTCAVLCLLCAGSAMHHPHLAMTDRHPAAAALAQPCRCPVTAESLPHVPLLPRSHRLAGTCSAPACCSLSASLRSAAALTRRCPHCEGEAAGGLWGFLRLFWLRKAKSSPACGLGTCLTATISSAVKFLLPLCSPLMLPAAPCTSRGASPPRSAWPLGPCCSPTAASRRPATGACCDAGVMWPCRGAALCCAASMCGRSAEPAVRQPGSGGCCPLPPHRRLPAPHLHSLLPQVLGRRCIFPDHC